MDGTLSLYTIQIFKNVYLPRVQELVLPSGRKCCICHPLAAIHSRDTVFNKRTKLVKMSSKPQSKRSKAPSKATFVVDASVPVNDKLIVAEQLVS